MLLCQGHLGHCHPFTLMGICSHDGGAAAHLLRPARPRSGCSLCAARCASWRWTRPTACWIWASSPRSGGELAVEGTLACCKLRRVRLL